MKRQVPAGRAMAMLLLAAGLAGCAAGPKYSEPVTPPITLASAQADGFEGAQADVAAAWWEIFDDAALNRAVETALMNNHDIRRAQANLLVARAVFDQRGLDRLPEVTTSADHVRSQRQQPLGDGQRTLSESWQAGFDVHWEIDLFGRLDRLAQAAEARAQASQADLAWVRLSVAAEVARVWFELQGLQQRLSLVRLDVESWRDTVRLTQASARAGAGLVEDVENARAHLSRSEAAIPPLIAGVQQLQYQLDILMAQRPGDGADLPSSVPFSAVPVQLSLSDVDRLIRRRPDVVRAERLLAASVEDVGAATAALYPRLDLAGFIGFFALRGSDLGSADSRAFDLAPGLHWPALRLGSARAQLRGAQAVSQGALADYELTLLRAQQDVENAVVQLAEHQRQLASLLQAQRHAQKALEIAGARYRAGAGSYLAVLENQRLLVQSRQQIAQVQTASQVHVISLYKALGWGAGDEDA